MTKKNAFDETHGDLIKSFFELYISNQEFSLKWEREFKSALLMEGRKIDTEYISRDTQDSFKYLRTIFNACLAEIKRNKRIIKPKNEAMFFVFRSLLVDLLDNLAKSFEYNLPFLQPHQVLAISGLSVYDQYRRYIFSKNQIFKIYVFLSNFSLNIGDEREIKLLKDIKIIKDVDYFSERDEFLGLKKDTALVFEFKTEKFGNMGNWNAENTISGFQYPHEEIRKELYAILTAFRLLKKGDIGVFAIKCINPSPFSRPLNVSPDLDFLVQFSGEQYQFDQKADLGKFKTLYKDVGEKPDCNELNVCISRFNKSYTRNDITDQIIDLVVAMEAVTTKTWDSLSYKVKTQLARLIGKDIANRQELAKKIGIIYGIRSDLVHEGKTKEIGKGKKFTSSRILLEEARDLLRNTITKMLNLMKKKSHKEIFENIIYG